MNTTLISFKTDPETKAELQAFAKTLGISTTAYINLVLKQTLRDRRIEVDAPLEPTPYLEKIMRETDEDIKYGRTIGPFSTADEMFEALEKTDDEA